MTAKTSAPAPHSRRALLAGAIGALAGLVGSRFASPDRTGAASGDPMIIGNTTNNAGTANTALTTASTGTALLITQNGTGTAFRGSAVGPGSIAGHFTANNGTGVSGVTGDHGSYGVFAQNNGPAAGAGGALRAAGGQNHGIVATTANVNRYAVSGTNDSNGANSHGVYGRTNAGTEGAAGVRGVDNGGVALTRGVWGSTTSTKGFGVFGSAETNSVNARGVYGVGNGVAYGVYGASSTGSGVYGTSILVGVEGFGGNGVYGHTDGGFGSAGIHGVGGSGPDSHGVLGEVTGISCIGVYGVNHADHATSVGVYGQTDAVKTGAAGIRGVDNGGSAITRGVWGSTTSTSGYGVLGEANSSSANAYGVAGVGTGAANGVSGVSSSGSGALGSAVSGTGVFGSSESGSGVYATSLTGMALHAEGNATVTGTLSKGAGSFRIDHPMDPANKFLYHSFVESPDMKNVYDGVATLDAKGRATVRLPDYFGALNRDVRYQLTAIGAAAASLHVARKMEDNTFRIAGGAAGQEVSWQVTGIRQDAYAKAHPIHVEVTKAKHEKGRYIHPVENGAPASRSIADLVRPVER
jgi:hypothetical protein